MRFYRRQMSDPAREPGGGNGWKIGWTSKGLRGGGGRPLIRRRRARFIIRYGALLWLPLTAVFGFMARRFGRSKSLPESKTVLGFEAPRSRMGQRVAHNAHSWKVIPLWAKLLPAAVGASIVLTLYAGTVFGNVAGVGGFSDTARAVVVFQAAVWGDDGADGEQPGGEPGDEPGDEEGDEQGDEPGDGNGNEDCAHGGNGNRGGHGHGGNCGSNGQAKQDSENEVPEGSGGAGVYDGAAENAALMESGAGEAGAGSGEVGGKQDAPDESGNTDAPSGSGGGVKGGGGGGE